MCLSARAAPLLKHVFGPDSNWQVEVIDLR